MKYFFLSYLFVAVAVVAFAGFRGHKFENPPWEIFDDMDDQAKVKYQRPSNFFQDGHAMRQPIKGTMPMGFEVPTKPASDGSEAQRPLNPQSPEFTHGTGYYYTGKFGDYYGDGMPTEIKVDVALLTRGQERYNIYCAVCHGTSGNGKGIITKHTAVAPTDLTAAGFDDASNFAFRPDGKIFDTITNGWNQMGAYGANISVQDRWAIVAYLRTLQIAAKNSVQ